jgi:hypothetical protein
MEQAGALQKTAFLPVEETENVSWPTIAFGELVTPPCFCVSSEIIGLTGECLVNTGMIGVRGEWLVANDRRDPSTRAAR